MHRGGIACIATILFAAVLILAGGPQAFAETSSEEINEMKSEIDERRASIDDINRKLDAYREKITQYSSQSASLMNDIALIENQAAMAELDIAATRNEIEAQTLEVSLLEARIREQNAELDSQRAMLSGMLFSLHQHEERGLVTTLFGSDSFHEAFDSVVQLEEVNAGLARAVDATKTTRANLEADRAEHELKLASLLDLERELEERVQKLAVQQEAKEVLVAQTASSEAEYRTLMSELRQEQQYIASQIAKLQAEMQGKIDAADEMGDSTVMTWPLTGIITTTFHDPTYPFRHLFEHSGLDIAIPVGTSVEASAPGYVAWARTGRQYGNYVMIIHANGMATLYAHLMRIDVVPDQYVTRGDQIGLSGGKPGMAGAGLSTGPHLHFEIRKDGIPVDPMLYLVD
ncbi:peptidoglycan DD-metalloendopeptidase family protein [Candidatus Uhrbacteria bacterium]|nr:peptidoglycan DD-metalloendopeptidase family protein [Candidatus Uhrbacteria bacterium]